MGEGKIQIKNKIIVLMTIGNSKHIKVTTYYTNIHIKREKILYKIWQKKKKIWYKFDLTIFEKKFYTDKKKFLIREK